MGANRHRGEVELKAGSQTFILRFTTNALVKLEDEVGKPVQELGTSMREARALVWAALLHAFPNLTLEQAGDIMDVAGWNNAVQKASEALSLAFGAGEAQGQGNPPAPGGATSPSIGGGSLPTPSGPASSPTSSGT
ncbi:MAG: hypothetical protein DIU55_006040 [Bacillota bacterium]